jgi:hypothetical protein
MNKEFCIQCGHKNMFEVSRPKFCAGCGSPFNTSAKTAPAKKVSQSDFDDNEDESVAFNQIDLSKLRNSIAYEGANNKVKLDDLWSNPAPRENIERRGFSGPDGQELLNQTEKECSTSKFTDVTDD